uniref:glycerol-3-phosphate dehydrogenase n=1 Tax=Parascaris equorum TaxID=6256 RepID=A0A914R442_PAREQ
MVREALFERANLLHCAPHLSYPLPIMLPIYNSYYINKEQALERQHNDARMNLSIVLTAIRQGAKAVNHTKLTGDEWDIKAKAVVNATGPFTDSLRLMADPDTKPICQPSAGVHIVLPGYYRMTVAGTTDAPMPVTFHPGPADIDIEFILQEIRTYLSDDVTGDF